MPNVFLAASVFGLALPQAAPVMVRKMPLEAAPGYTAHYSGRLLSQTHADLTMALMSLASGVEQGSTVTLRACDLERVLEHSSGRRNRESLEGLLHDIANATLYVKWNNSTLYGSLLPLGRADGDLHTLRINPEMMALALEGFTLVDLDARRRLARRPLAQWLQLFTAWQESQGVRAVELGEVHRVSRSAVDMRMMRFRVREALAALGDAGVHAWRLGADDRLRAA